MWRLPCQLVRTSIFLPVILTTCVTNVLAQNVLAQGATTFAQGWQSGTPATVTGVLSTLYADDFANRRSELINMIRDERTGQSFRLRFEKEVPAAVRPNAKVTVSGRMRGSEIYMQADQVSSTTNN